MAYEEKPNHDAQDRERGALYSGDAARSRRLGVSHHYIVPRSELDVERADWARGSAVPCILIGRSLGGTSPPIQRPRAARPGRTRVGAGCSEEATPSPSPAHRRAAQGHLSRFPA